MKQASLEWLENPEVFEVNRLEATSSHKYYGSLEDLNVEKETFKQLLNGTWKFSYASHPEARNKDFYKLDADLSDFNDITVPAHIQMEGYDHLQYINTLYPWDGHDYLRPPFVSKTDNPVGSYVTYFTLEEPLKNKKIRLQFDGVESAMYVYVNGEFVGYSEDSFTPSSFDITDYLVAGTNKLAVEVYKRCSGSWIEDQDFWRFSGIFRDVALYAIPDVHINDVEITTDLMNDYYDALVGVQLDVLGENYRVKAILHDKEGLAVGEYEGIDNFFSFDLKDINLWSSEDPYLYTLQLELYKEDALVEVVPVKVGLREFKMDEGVMLLNGERIVFRGVNRHEFNCFSGRVVTHEDMMFDIEFMKRHNINAVRTSHYPNNNEWYDLCDEYGIYLIDETNMESHGSWQKLGQCEPSWNIPGNLPEWQQCVLDRAKSMLERDKNHPSILIWSLGNESYAGVDILNMAKYFRKRDPRRLVHYEGCTWNREYSDCTDMESRMYAKAKDIEDYLKDDPSKPYISCEYMHAMGNSLGGMSKYIELEDKYEKYQGGFIWDYIDQAISYTNDFGEEVLGYGGDFDDRNTDYNFCGDGIIFADRTLSPKAAEVKYQYQDVVITPTAKNVRIRSKRLFKDTSDLFFVYQVKLGDEIMKQGSFEANVIPQSFMDVDVDFGEYKDEVIITVSAHLKEDTLWAEAGFEVGFGQCVIGKYEEIETENTPLMIIPGDGDLGVRCGDFSVLFAQEGMTSLKYKDKEFIERGPRPTFARATTDNIHGYHQDLISNLWIGASLTPTLSNMHYDIAPDFTYASITYEYTVFPMPQIKVDITYTVKAPGVVRVTYHYHGNPGLPDVPMFGTLYTLTHKLNHFAYYGRGPEENYVDRKEGSRIDTFDSTVEENMTPYLLPQACGNRCDCREVALLDEDEQGLLFTMVDTPFEMSVLPHSFMTIEAAKHIYELPRSYYTYLTIASKQMGVGGDDSWGAPVLEEYTLKADEDVEYSIDISLIM